MDVSSIEGEDDTYNEDPEQQKKKKKQKQQQQSKKRKRSCIPRDPNNMKRWTMEEFLAHCKANNLNPDKDKDLAATRRAIANRESAAASRRRREAQMKELQARISTIEKKKRRYKRMWKSAMQMLNDRCSKKGDEEEDEEEASSFSSGSPLGESFNSMEHFAIDDCMTVSEADTKTCSAQASNNSSMEDVKGFFLCESV